MHIVTRIVSNCIPDAVGRRMVAWLAPRVPRWERRLISLGKHFADGPPRIVETSAGFRMELDLNDRIERRIYYTGRYERGVEMMLRRALAPGGCFVDVGANCGYFSLLAATLVGQQGRVHAFEPFPETVRRLRRNVALNPRLENVVLHLVALSDRAGECRLFQTQGNLGLTSMSSGEAPSLGEAVEDVAGGMPDGAACIVVPSAPLDVVWSEQGSPRVDFMKIDIEGAEVLALEGMHSMLASTSCRNILVEIHPQQIIELGRRPQRIAEILLEHGYRLRTGSQGRLVELDPVPFFQSDAGHRFVLATLDDTWNNFALPSGF